MRSAGPTIFFALALGAAAVAQESPGINPAPAQPAAEQKPAPAVQHTKRGKSKTAAPRIAAPQAVTARQSEAAADLAKSDIAPDAAITEPDGAKIQSALIWSGDYTGSLGDDPFSSAVRNYQKRTKAKITGVLSAAERTALLAAAQTHEDEYGWTVVVDPATGVRIGLPLKLVSQTRDAARGTRWSSPHGDVQVETFRIKNPDLKLAAFFDQQKKEPAGRKVEYSTLHDDDFVIGGMQGLKKFTVRAYARDGEIRGATVLFDQMMETIVTPVLSAMTSAFAAFPERGLPFAAMTRSVDYGSGLVVSRRGHIVTDRKLASGCQVIIAAGLGNADPVAVDNDNGLALLRVYGPLNAAPAALAPDMNPKGDITLVGIPDPREQNGLTKLTEVKARLTQTNGIELRQDVPMSGFSGAPAVDAHGQVIGIMEMRNFVLASNEPAAAPVHLISSETIRAFMATHGVNVENETGEAKASIVRIICVRK
jgi:S1-C subfamily serine protease